MRGRRATSTPKEGELMGELKRADRRCDVLCSGTWCLRAVPGSRFVCLLSFQCWLQGSVFKLFNPAPIFNLQSSNSHQDDNLQNVNTQSSQTNPN